MWGGDSVWKAYLGVKTYPVIFMVAGEVYFLYSHLPIKQQFIFSASVKLPTGGNKGGRESRYTIKNGVKTGNW